MSTKNISESFSIEQGQRLRMIRKEIGLTPEQAAAKANVSAQQWRKYERGEAEPKISKLIFLFQLGYSLDWLMRGVAPKQTGEQEQKGNESTLGTVSLTERRKQKRRHADDLPINEQLLPINEWLAELPIEERLEFLQNFRGRFASFDMWWQKKTGRENGNDIAVGEDTTAED